MSRREVLRRGAMSSGFFSHISFLFLIFSLIGGSFGVQILVTGGSRGQVLQNDKYGNDCDIVPEEPEKCFGGWGRRKAWFDRFRAEDPASLAVDIGEIVGFKSFWRFFQGTAHNELLAAIGYDTVGIAKSDLFQGIAAFESVIAGPNVRAVMSNMDTSPMSISSEIEPYVIVSKGGTTFGATCLFNPERASQTNVDGVTILNEYSSLGLVIGEMRSKGVDVIVVLAGQYLLSDVKRIIDNVLGIDLIISDFESEEPLTKYKGVTVASCPECERGDSMLRLSLSLTGAGPGKAIASASRTIQEFNTESDAIVAPDAAVSALVATRYATVKADEEGTILGEVAADLVGEREVCRFGTCSFGNALADTVRMTAGVQVALINSGGIRGTIDKGLVTFGRVLTVVPFGDVISTFKIKGGHLAATLQHGIEGIASGSITGRFPQISGMRFTWNKNSSIVTAVEIEKLDEPGVFEPIDLLATYTMATLQFVRQGGDGYSILENHAIDPNDLGPSMKEKFADRIRAARPEPFPVPEEMRIFHSPFNESILSTCPDGYESAGEFGCVKCPAGSFSSNEMTNGLCRDCLDGFYSDVEGSATCTACPAHSRTYMPAAATILACQCEKEYYGENGDECKPCPIGGQCRGGSSLVGVAPGYYRSEIVDLTFHACIPSEACQGTLDGTELGQCSDGYAGPNCGECDRSNGDTGGDIYFRKNRRCHKCVNPDSALLVLGFFVSIVAASMLFVVALYYARDTSVRRRGIISSFGLVVQTFALFGDFYGGTWPSGLEPIFNIMAFFNLNIDLFGFECTVTGSYFGKWFLGMLIPVFFVAIVVLVVVGYSTFIHFSRSKYPSEEARHAARTHMIDSSISACCALAIFGYAFVASATLSIFDCTSEPDGSHYLVSQPSIQCSMSDDIWKRLSVLAILFAIIYVIGIPVGMFFFIRDQRVRWLEKGNMRAERRIRVFVDEFKENEWWWIVVLILWRLIFVVAKSFVPVEWGLRGGTGALMVTGLLLLKLIVRPRIDPLTAKIDAIATAGVALTFFLGLLLHSVVENPDEKDVVVALFYMTVIAVLIFIGIIIAFGFYKFAERRFTQAEKGQRSPKVTDIECVEADAFAERAVKEKSREMHPFAKSDAQKYAVSGNYGNNYSTDNNNNSNDNNDNNNDGHRNNNYHVHHNTSGASPYHSPIRAFSRDSVDNPGYIR